ncbi:hypothetical protein MYXO_01478 [Myxococcaceae bacterium]|jgi:hypothetical protein|nr:hypothetical protein MYXO_01478 [Myxococcaceae bacterium]
MHRPSIWLRNLPVAAFAIALASAGLPASAIDRDDNPPGPGGGPGTNWENRPGPRGGAGASPNLFHRPHRIDRDNNPPGRVGGPGTNWENPKGPIGGPGASPDRRPHRARR